MCRGIKASYGATTILRQAVVHLGGSPARHGGAQQEGNKKSSKRLKQISQAPWPTTPPANGYRAPSHVLWYQASGVLCRESRRRGTAHQPPRLTPAFRAGMFGTQTALNTEEGRQLGRKTVFSPPYRGHFTRYRWHLPGGPGVQSPTRCDPLSGHGAGRFSPQSR